MIASQRFTLGLLFVASSCADQGPTKSLRPSGTSIPCHDAPWAGEVCIPGGDFVMGHEQTPGISAFVGPPHLVWLSPYFIDAYPATNAEYTECFNAGACPLDFEPGGGCGGAFCDVYRIRDPALSAYPLATALQAGAEAYCHFKGKRLPTEAQWERTARGPQSFDYPWGNEPPDCSRAPCGTPGDPATIGGHPPATQYHYPVGGNPGDVTPEGVHELVTGVPEAVADAFDIYTQNLGPVFDPVGVPQAGATPSWVVRGNVGVADEYNGKSFPLPAWWHFDDWPGGVRCARTDSGGADGRDPASVPQTCRDGRCLAGPQVNPRAIAVGGGNAYWLTGYSSGGTVQTIAATGGTQRMIATTAGEGQIALDDTAVYWVSGALSRAPLSGGPAVELASGACGLAVDATNIYYGGTGVYWQPKVGGAASMLIGGQACVAAIDNAGVYYWSGADHTQQTLMRIAKSGGAPVAIGTVTTLYSVIVVTDATSVYWLGPSQTAPRSAIWSAPTGGGTPIELYSTADYLRTLAIDATDLYWIEHTVDGASQIRRQPLAGGAATTLASGEMDARAIALDAGFVYWVDAGSYYAVDGAVKRMPK